MALTAKSVATIKDWAKGNSSRLTLVGRPILFWNPENGSTEESLIWWRIPVSLHPHLWKWQRLDQCSVSLAILKSGAVEAEHEMCWHTSEGPQRAIDLKPNTIYSVPIAIRRDREAGRSGLAEKGISLSLPARVSLIMNSDLLVERKISDSGLENKDYVIELQIRRQSNVIKKSALYVLEVPPANQNNRHFSLRLRQTVPEVGTIQREPTRLKARSR